MEVGRRSGILEEKKNKRGVEKVEREGVLNI
jgi:hypothetical protein